MSRSHKRTPKYGFSHSENDDKRRYNRAFRRSIKGSNRPDDPRYIVPPDIREHSDPWAMAKDGKRWFDPETQPKLLRK